MWKVESENPIEIDFAEGTEFFLSFQEITAIFFQNGRHTRATQQNVYILMSRLHHAIYIWIVYRHI